MRFWRTAGALAVGLVLGASAVAMGVDTTPQYTGCLAKDGTILKVAVGSEPKQVCGKTETLISWNQVGPKGDPGEAGDAGVAGPSAYAVAVANGYTGTEPEWLASLVGQQGEPGAAGAAGPQGPAGPAELIALWNTDCMIPGAAGPHPGRLSFSIDSATGVVTLTCLRVHTVTVSVTGGVLDNIDIRFPASDGTMCSKASECSFTYWEGASYAWVLLSNTSFYLFDCDGTTAPAPEEHGSYYGSCPQWSPFTSDHTVTIYFPS